MTRAVLALEDGTFFEGESFGATGVVAGEAVFNTSAFGYQEILTDPSYAGQIVTMAASHIGNVGTNALDQEGARPHAVGLVVRAASGCTSNWRSTQSLHDYLEQAGTVAVSGIDTRRLVRHLRIHGAQRSVLSTTGESVATLVDRARALPSMEGLDLATPISTTSAYEWTKGSPSILGTTLPKAELRHHVVACDYGLKRAMLEQLVDVGCRVTVVPATFDAERILSLKPDGVFLSNGPGDPAAVVSAERTVRALLGHVPIFGICLGHQILARALGCNTFKMKFGHRGANQPVKDRVTGQVEITVQNHGFAVDEASVGKHAEITHVNLNDGTVEGLAVPEARAMSVQYHPEASPGPHDARHLFQRFVSSL